MKFFGFYCKYINIFFGGFFSFQVLYFFQIIFKNWVAINWMNNQSFRYGDFMNSSLLLLGAVLS